MDQNSNPAPPEGSRSNRILTDLDRAIHEWQLDVPGFGEEGQTKLKNATVLVSRIGGLGGAVVWDLATAGIGRLVLAHAGHPKPSDFNRQTLMHFDRQDEPRVTQAADKLHAFKPNLEIVTVEENISNENADRLIDQVDVVIDCAPLFEERLAMNDSAWKLGKPVVECAMYEMQGSLTFIEPGKSPCLRCLVPTPPPQWKRRFPVFGAVAATIGSLAALEAIKYLGGFGQNLLGRQLYVDLRTMTFHSTAISKNPACPVCCTK